MESTGEKPFEKPLRFALSAGELSGDERGAELVSCIKQLLPGAVFAGMGGRNMDAAGVRLIVNAEREGGSLMGFQEVLASFRSVYTSLVRMKQLMKDWRPDVLVLIDYPDFNFRIGKFAAAAGIPVFYYITPKLWAWRKGRVRFFRQYVSKASCIFPFEPEFFRSRGYEDSVYVSHPFSLKYRGCHETGNEEKAAFRSNLGLAPDRPVVCFFPGSRKHEIKEHRDLVIDTWNMIKERHSELQGVMAAACSLEKTNLLEPFHALSDFTVTSEDPVSVMRASDAGMIKSGTSNLQAAFCGLPFFMFFRAAAFSAFVAKHFVGLPEYSIVNILKPGTVRELLQEEADPANSCRELEGLLFDETRRIEVQKGLRLVREMLSIEGESAAQRTARLVIDLALAQSA